MKYLIFFLSSFFIFSTIRAEIKPNSLFCDDSVLQIGIDMPAWGYAKEGENSIVLNNNLVGEVICAGQSNMEWALFKSTGGEEAMATSTNPKPKDSNSMIGDTTQGKLQNRLRELNKDILQKGIIWDTITKSKLLTGYSYGQFYDWDLYFENIYMSYYGIPEYNFANLNAFLKMQQPDGFIKRSFGKKNYGANHMFKPFIAQIALLGSRSVGNFEWAKQHYPQIKSYLKKWFSYDTDGNGLVYWSGGADHSGMDNQTTRCLGKSEGVDLNCYLVRELKAMAIIAKALGYTKDEKEFLVHAEQLKSLINKFLWDEKTGFYYDRNEVIGKTTFVKSISGFTPIWAEVATKKQADRLVKEHLTNPQEFWLEFPVPGYAKSEPDYYQGTRHGECNWRGSTWIPTNYMICHGLVKYGYKKVAKELASKTFNMVLNNKTTREYYDAISGQGYGMNPFYGWSSLAYYLPLEIETDYNPTDLNIKQIKKLSDEVGVIFNPDMK